MGERKERKGKDVISFSAFGEFVTRFLVLWGVKYCKDLLSKPLWDLSLGFAQWVVGWDREANSPVICRGTAY